MAGKFNNTREQRVRFQIQSIHTATVSVCTQ